MNICFVNPTKKLRVGIKGLSKCLVSRGHKVVILTAKRPRQEELKELEMVKVIVYPSLSLPKIRYTIPFSWAQLSKTIREEKTDIIHIWTHFYPTVWLPVFYATTHHIPIILTTVSFPGISWRYGSKFVDFMAKIYSKSVGRIILRYCNNIILQDSSLVNIAQGLGIKEDNLFVIPNGVDFARFNLRSSVIRVRKSLGIHENESMILNVGRLVPVKGIDILIKITEKLLNDGYKIRTVIVGDGPYKKKYDKMANNLKKNIIFAGFRTDIPELVSACDVFVLPSISEGLPSALLEAGACGKPLVASDTGGIPDIIIHGKTGFLAEPKDADSFVCYIKLVLNDKTLAQELGREAYEHVRKKFDWEVIVKRYEEIYDALLSKKEQK